MDQYQTIGVPPDMDNWVGGSEACRIMNIHVTTIAKAVLTYRIDHQMIIGRRAYYKPDCERAAAAIAQMRAKREANQTNQAQA